MEPLQQDPTQRVFVDTKLAGLCANNLQGLPQYSLHCMINRQPIDLAPSAQLVSDCSQRRQQVSTSQPVRSRLAEESSEQPMRTDHGIEAKGSLLNLLAKSGTGSEYKLYLGAFQLPKRKGFGVRALEFIPAGAYN